MSNGYRSITLFLPNQLLQESKDAPYCLGYHPNPSTPKHPFPGGACDTHAHICGPEASVPYHPARIYTPPDALLPAYESMLKILGVERMVLVQPSIYGEDNSVMLKAMKETSLQARGVAVVPMDTVTGRTGSSAPGRDPWRSILKENQRNGG
jgi:hypothetical protein